MSPVCSPNSARSIKVHQTSGAVVAPATGHAACRGFMADGLLEAVRGLHLAHPELGPKPLLAKLREQQPDLAAGNKEVREVLAALSCALLQP